MRLLQFNGSGMPLECLPFEKAILQSEDRRAKNIQRYLTWNAYLENSDIPALITQANKKLNSSQIFVVDFDADIVKAPHQMWERVQTFIGADRIVKYDAITETATAAKAASTGVRKVSIVAETKHETFCQYEDCDPDSIRHISILNSATNTVLSRIAYQENRETLEHYCKNLNKFLAFEPTGEKRQFLRQLVAPFTESEVSDLIGRQIAAWK